MTEIRSDWDKAPIWFKWALHEIGIREEPENRGPHIREYIKIAHAGSEGDPWCAIFVNAALEASGVKGTKSASSQSFRHDENFVTLKGPSLGAIAVFWRGSIASGLGHVGLYRGENKTHVYVLGGNEGDMVQIEPLSKHRSSFGLIGYWWPKAIALTRIGVVPIRSGQPLGSQEKVT